MKKFYFIIFIAILSSSNVRCKKDAIITNQPPTAIFTVSASSGTTNTNFTFDASGCTDNETQKSELQVHWDFDGNGSWDTSWDTDKSLIHQYSNESRYTVILEVKDTEGLISKYTKSIFVNNGGSGTFTDPRDRQIYSTVEIGDQTWFAENLNYVTKTSWTYDDDSVNGDIYGRLYNCDAALKACPSGWHLPSDEEWKTLEMALGMSQSEADATGWRGSDQGKIMKSTSGWHIRGNGTNISGFNALPGGLRLSFGSYTSLDSSGGWWSATNSSGNYAWGRYLQYFSRQIARNDDDRARGRSVRCLKD